MSHPFGIELKMIENPLSSWEIAASRKKQPFPSIHWAGHESSLEAPNEKQAERRANCSTHPHLPSILIPPRNFSSSLFFSPYSILQFPPLFQKNIWGNIFFLFNLSYFQLPDLMWQDKRIPNLRNCWLFIGRDWRGRKKFLEQTWVETFLLLLFLVNGKYLWKMGLSV